MLGGAETGSAFLELLHDGLQYSTLYFFGRYAEALNRN